MSEQNTAETAPAVAAGVQQALIAAAPAILAAAAANDPRIQLALIAAMQLVPAVAQLLAAFNTGAMTQETLEENLSMMRQTATEAHEAWMASIAGN